MIEVHFRPPTPSDLDSLAERMRSADRRECALLTALAPRAALAQCVADSDPDWVFAAETDGKVMAIFGLATPFLLEDESHPWMLCAEGIEHCAKAIIAKAPEQIAAMRGTGNRLSNIVLADNRQAIRFIKWCGFTFGEARNIGGETFLDFEWRQAA